ncbi:unnamed protein product [Spirodela intermedia]|uniref:glucan endo-1,3-beta-D-glucosidase n=1 Tax=Spirodela intermedia TaxID=51605 RepID=A0A7I8IUD6_SPIIN|nr:unnamed protein product [Spirodela intermedia]CAA6661487.1 unnamed protein product [Spirodela intermedia]
MPRRWKKPFFSSAPFRFPETESVVLPDPSAFFSKRLLSSPLPTNSFFQNFVLNDGDQPEYIHPYLVKSSGAAVGLSFPSRVAEPRWIYQSFVPDISISSFSAPPPTVSDGGDKNHDDHRRRRRHLITSFDDLSVTMDLPGGFGASSSIATGISIATSQDVLYFTSDSQHTKHTLQLTNGRTYLCYSSSPLHVAHTSLSTLVTTADYAGVLRFAYLPDPKYESILDRYSSCYPISGEADLTRPFSVKYKWKTRGTGELLLLAHPLHLRLLVEEDGNASASAVLRNFKYESIDGDLVGVVGRSWVLKADPIPITWYSILGLTEESYGEVISALYRDVDALKPIATTSTYGFGKEAARAARLALIAEEVRFPNLVPAVQLFLENSITPWLEGTFFGNAFLHDASWGGLITKQGAIDGAVDSGFSIYNAHHYHLGYFLYAIAVLSKIDSVWGKAYKGQAYALAKDIVNLDRGPRAHYARLRCFDLWKLHSWEGGLAEFVDGRNQQGTSEAVNAYYAAALLGMAHGDSQLIATASTLAALEIQAAQTWWHVRQGQRMYEEDFTKENRLVGVLWANKRDSALWFAPPESKDIRLGIHVLPLLPITEVLFRDLGFVREMVDWAAPAMERDDAEESWKGFVHAMEAVYDNQAAARKIRTLSDFDAGNSLSNLLWWLHSRAGSGGDKVVPPPPQGELALGCCRRRLTCCTRTKEEARPHSGGALACCRKMWACCSRKLLHD